MVTLRIKELSKQNGIALNVLAEQIGISATSLSCIITGKQKPSLDTLEKIANALGVPISELFEAPKTGAAVCPYCGKELKIKIE